MFQAEYKFENVEIKRTMLNKNLKSMVHHELFSIRTPHEGGYGIMRLNSIITITYQSKYLNYSMMECHHVILNLKPGITKAADRMRQKMDLCF
jgi:hypothetical protein